MTPMTRALAILLLATAAQASAQAGRAAPAQARHLNALDGCRAITTDAARLACFDREAATLVAASRSGEVSVVDRADLRSARRSLFGFSLPKLPFFSGDRSAEEVPDSLDSTIVSAQGIANGRYRIRVAAGDAVWETTESPIRLGAPRAGQKIVIRKGALGNYFLRIDGQVGVRGRRVQ